MLSKLNRLSDSRAIRNIQKRGYSFSASLVALKALKNDLDVSRFAFIVSNKIHKKSTKRNLAKRRMRAAVRSGMKNIKNGVDIIISARPAIILDKKKVAPYKVIREEIGYALEKMGLLK